MSLQRRWAEAEMNLRQALALTPDHRRAHNNLGLVLAHAGRWDDALVAFGKGGCDPAEAHVNLAFVLTLEHCWPEARTHYEQALALQPASASAKKGLEQLQGLMAKGEGTEDPLGTGNRSRRVRGSARDEPNPAAALGVPTAQSSQVPMGSRSLDSGSPATAVSLPAAAMGRSPTAVTPAVYAPRGASGPPATPGEIRPSRPAVDPATEPPMPRCNEIQSAAPPFPTPMPAASQVVATPPPSNPATTRGSMPVSQEALEPEPAPAVVSPLVRLQQQVEALCGDTGKDVEVRAESPTSLRIRFTVRSAEDGYKLATKVLWLPELGPYQVALDIRVVL